MIYPTFFDSKNSLNLFGLKKKFDFLLSLYMKKCLPKILMFTGNKGLGKSTLLNHFLFSIFDEENYDRHNCHLLNTSSFFYNQFKNNIFSNIIYLKGSDFNSAKIDQIRDLKTKIFKSTVLNKDRFILLDDIELFNKNSLNSLLKIIEEPSKNNFFFLINNKSKPLLETINSRVLEIKIILNENIRLEITNKLITFYKLKTILDPKNCQLSPGNFIKFDYIFREFNLSLKNDFLDNLSTILNLYKKNKDILFINIAFFITDLYFEDFKNKNIYNKDKTVEIKNFIFSNLNSFLLYNINLKALINALNIKLKHE